MKDISSYSPSASAELKEDNDPKLLTAYISIILLFTIISLSGFYITSFVLDKLAAMPDTSYITDNSAENPIDTENNFSEIIVKRGDNLSKILKLQNIDNNEINKILESIKKSKIDFALRPGNIVTFNFSISDIDILENSLNNYSLEEIVAKLDHTRNIVISKIDGGFVTKEIKKELHKKFVKHLVTINNSLVSALSKIGISAGNIQDIIKAYSHEIDFQRQIKKGDSISVITEKLYTEDGEFVQNGKIIFSSLNLSGKDHNIYWFKDKKTGKSQYYTEIGKSVKKSLLKTPINVAKISSRFGMRKHPILGYAKMHKGVDFRAPIGTPILAAGDGVIKDIGYRGAYGNIIKIKHSGTLTTAYAHASKFAKNLKLGTKVKQGQVIAYVGKSGRVTGPHLHFEVIINGNHVNPMNVHTTSDEELKGESLKLFAKYKESLKEYHSNLQEGNPAKISQLDYL